MCEHVSCSFSLMFLTVLYCSLLPSDCNSATVSFRIVRAYDSRDIFQVPAARGPLKSSRSISVSSYFSFTEQKTTTTAKTQFRLSTPRHLKNCRSKGVHIEASQPLWLDPTTVVIPIIKTF